MSLLFDSTDGRHDYWLDGARVPSVTQVLKDSGLIRLDGIPPFILEAALKRGSTCHQLIHYYNENDLDWSSVDVAYRGYIDGWVSFREQHRVMPLLCEHRVASPRHRVAGTIDLLCEIDNEGWLLDFKTGNPEDVAADLQTAAYVGLSTEWRVVDEQLSDAFSRFSRWRRASVRLRKDGSFRLIEYSDPRDYSRFQILAAAWHIRSERGAIIQPDDVAA